LETPDRDFLDIDFFDAPSVNRGGHAPLVVILHGLEGSSGAPYIKRLLREIRKRGWNAAAMNMRMCSGEPNRLVQTYHSGKTEDLDFVLGRLKDRRAWHEIYLVGYSIGGNIALKWMGEQAGRASEQIQKAVVVSVPYDLTKSVGELDQGFNRAVYTAVLLRSLKRKVRRKVKMFPGAITYDRVKHCKTFKEFDNKITAPLNGFKDERDYWSRSSSMNFLKSIRVPTLLIHAEDDPFFPGEFLPREDFEKSTYLKSLIVSEGGHVGFVSGAWPWRQTPWLEQQIMNFFDE